MCIRDSDKDRGLLAFGPFNFSYLALYKKEGDNFKLLWERMPEKENYSVVDGAIRFDRSVMGVRDICMTKIILLLWSVTGKLIRWMKGLSDVMQVNVPVRFLCMIMMVNY